MQYNPRTMSGPEGSSIKRSIICAIGHLGFDPFFMQYQVLARKWRPRNFHELVGQEHVSRTLINALQGGRLAHAFLFSGPRGSGKTTSARILAKALNCHAGKPGEPCSQCPACVEIAAGNCVDVLEIDAASNRGIDEIRKLKEEVGYNPARDRNKIFIIDEVHMLTSEAFNALLKTLEEPPPRVVFIMATTEYHKIPATILSRCQQYTFKLIPYPLILNRLREITKKEGIQISNGSLEQVVFASGGSMRDAMSALDQVLAFSGSEVRDEDVAALLGLVEPEVLGRTVRAISQNDPAALLQIVGTLAESGHDLNNFCRRVSAQFRNLMVLKAGISDPALLGIPESLLPDLRKQAELFSREDLIRLFDAFQKVETGMKYAAQVRFQLEMGLIELAHVAHLKPIEELIAQFSSCVDDAPVQRPAVQAPETRPRVPSLNSSAAAEVRQPYGAVETRSRERQAQENPAEAIPEASEDLLSQITGAVKQEHLKIVMQSLTGARLQNNQVILDAGAIKEFAKKQIQENLKEISEAASSVLGRNVSAVLSSAAAPPAGTGNQKPESPKPEPGNPNTGTVSRDLKTNDDLLEKAKREPIVKSFFDNFPGPVTVEKIDS